MDRIDPASLQNYMQRLAREKGFLETIFNTIKEGILVTDAAGRLRYLNRAAATLLGASQDDAIGEPITNFLRGWDWAKIAEAHSDESRKVVAREFEVFYPRHRFLNFYILPIEASGEDEKPGFVVIVGDTTELRQRTEETIESERLNALMLLAATVAHELGNPLNSLTIHLQLLERELKKLPAAKRKAMEENLGVAIDEIARLDYIISGFLRAMRPARLNLQPSDVNQLIFETMQVIQPELDDRGIVVEQQLAPKLPRIPLDTTQIKQAFFNIIKNAAQAMSSGGVLRLATITKDNYVIVSFSDGGSGIRREDVGKIFEPFQTTKTSGSGLGLMIVQRIVREHGGELELETEEGVGTTVRLRLLIHPRHAKLLEAPHIDASAEENLK